MTHIPGLRIRLAAGLLLGALPGPLVAQPGTPPSLARIGPGCCTLRVRHDGLTAQGLFQGSPAARRLVLRPCRGPLCPSPADSVLVLAPGAVVEMRDGTRAGAGALIGAVAGVVVAAGGMAAAEIWGGDVQAGDMVLLVPVSALAGTVLGAGVGLAFPRWRPVAP